MRYILQTDGGSRGNPGPAAAGWVIFKDSRNPYEKKDLEGPYIPDDEFLKVEAKGSKYLGIQTNNYAEYSAIVEGMKACLERGITSLRVKMDSQLATNQINGLYKIKNEAIKKFVEEINELQKKFDYVIFTHVYRSKNKDADKMVNLCLDEQIGKKK